ncbi:MAG TPA: alpha/beta fold hydrolase [Dehalococcoidia bacterium]|nr:alpha/beta fold hydrolase [Dehalococcoidia bacterium]
MPTVDVGGLELHYREAGSGTPVLLVHGFTGNSRNWALTVPSLRPHYRVVSPDLPGHGLSGRPTEPGAYTLEAMAEAVSTLMDRLGLEGCHLVGHSMGGMIAQVIALSRPQRLRSLVLVDTSAEPPEGLRTRERARLVELAREQGMEAVWEAQLAMNPMADQLRAQPQFLQTWREQFLMTSREAYIYCARAMAQRRPLLDDLSRLSLPVLIVCGENDEPFVEPSRRMHERIAGSQLALIPRCGHTPQVERPDEFNAVLLRFLRQVDGAAAK